MVTFSEILSRGRFFMIASHWLIHDTKKKADKVLDLIWTYVKYGVSEDLFEELDRLEIAVRRNADTIVYFSHVLRDGEAKHLSSIIRDVTLGRPSRTHLKISVLSLIDGPARDIELRLANAFLLKIALDNLLDNAARAAAQIYSGDGGGAESAESIEFSYAVDAEHRLIYITLRNRGHLDKNWVDGKIARHAARDGTLNNNSRPTHATGLGLVIDCVQYFKGGSIEFDVDEVGRSVTVRIIFPY